VKVLPRHPHRVVADRPADLWSTAYVRTKRLSSFRELVGDILVRLATLGIVWERAAVSLTNFPLAM
jgi:predicted GTPase